MHSAISQTWSSRLKENGFRLTPPLIAIIETITACSHMQTAQQVYDLARKNHPELGMMTVYRTLDKLEELRLIQKVHTPQGCHAYAPAPDGHQHLLLCLTCGKIEYFSGDELESLFHVIGHEKRYAIKEHWLQLFGECSDCRNPDPA